ncbi:MAG: M23 family metallopeptidase [Gammaproteobacteria bacterium]|nr:M23 family metallopeptidase [Gammaproteobacteria bacterium]
MKRMILFSLIQLVVFPLGSLANLLFTPGTTLEWLVIALQTAALFALNHIVGRWYWLNYNARQVSLAILVLALGYSYFMLEPGLRDSSYLILGINLVILTFWLLCLLKAIRSAVPPVAPYPLVFPLEGGSYYTTEGGSSRLTNNHHVNRAQRYALDFYQLDRLGRRCKGLFPKDLESYVIFCEPLYAPASGTILKARDGLHDMTPPEMDEVNRAGNHVLIRTDDDRFIVMAHMKKGSVTVSEGDRVEAGNLLGRVGNSGRSEEPHLHIHCMETLEEDYVRCGHGIPVQFDGRYLLRNQCVSHHNAQS